MKELEHNGIVADGRERALAANRPYIEVEVRERYAAELAEADFSERLRIEIQIRREIEAALKQAAPLEGLY